MKCMSVQQPWAWCIVTGRKPVENRTWPTKYRGAVLIHASKKFDMAGLNWLKQQQLIPWEMSPDDFKRGGIVGQADITDCVTQMDSVWFQGPYGFVLQHARELFFIPMRGMLGIFEVGNHYEGGVLDDVDK